MTPFLIDTPTDADFIRTSADFIATRIRSAISHRGQCLLGLSGGSTPRPVYEALGEQKTIDWSKVWIFLVDDRYIRADSPHSNQFLLRSTLLRNAPIPESQVVVPDVSLPLPECVALYAKHIAPLLSRKPDLLVLGIGEDGHIASLFPPLDPVQVSAESVLHTVTSKFTISDRITLSLGALTEAKESVFLFSGAAKRAMWKDMIKSTENTMRWPAKRILETMPVTAIVR